MIDSLQNILIIRHGALGDVVLSTGPFAAIRKHHPNARITLLTTKPYAKLLEPSPYFDAIVVDEKPRWWELAKLKRLKSFFCEGQFNRVYDLQTSQRSTWYYTLLPAPKPEFSGLAKGASHRHHTPERTRLHTIERQKQQLAIAGIADVPPPDVSWLKGKPYAAWEKEDRRPGESRDLNQEDSCLRRNDDRGYVLLIPGGSAHRPEKRWPVEYFIEVSRWLVEQGIQPVLIGTQAEAEILEAIAAKVPVLNLCNQTSFADIAELARGALFTVGNDTGPMHLAAATGCRAIALFNTTASNPALCAPRGNVDILHDDDMKNIIPQMVINLLQA